VSWSIATYRRGEATGLGALLENGTLLEPPELKRWATALELLDDWPQAETILRGIETSDAPALDYETLLAPIRWPRKVICAGVNYRRHIREMGGDVPDADWRPFFFLKTPTTTVIGPTDPIILHGADTAKYDWEAELAVIIGIGGRDIPTSRALDHAAGYCVANDVTARGLHKRHNVPAEAFAYDWYAAKSLDSSLPLGPGITPSFFVLDPQNLRVRLWVNDEPQQDESTSDMICTVAELIAAASEITRLEPGDVITTGTPSGVGVGRGLSLRGGDRVRTTIDGLGTLDNPVADHTGGTR